MQPRPSADTCGPSAPSERLIMDSSSSVTGESIGDRFQTVTLLSLMQLGLADQHLEREPAAELAPEGEREPELCQRVDEVEGVDAAEPDGPESDVRDQTVGDLLRAAFLGRVEEVGRDPVEDGIGEVLPAERVERADGMGAVGEFLERVQLAGALDVVGRVDHDLARQRCAECGEDVLRRRSRDRQHHDLRGGDCVRDRRRIGRARGADAVDDLMAGGHPLGAEGAADVSGSDHRDPQAPASVADSMLSIAMTSSSDPEGLDDELCGGAA